MKKSSIIALSLLFIITAWILSGQIIGNNSAITNKQNNELQSDADVSNPHKSSAISVSVEQMEIAGYTDYIELYGNSEAIRVVDLVAETEGQVLEINADDGQYVKQGELLITIDERERAASLAEAKALLTQREIEYRAAKQLKDSGFRAETNLAAAKTALESAKASVLAREIDYNKTKIIAPFDGILEKIHTEIGALVGAGFGPGNQVVATMAQLNPIVIKASITEADRARIIASATKDKINVIGMPAVISFYDDSEYQGKIKYISSIANQSTRTYDIEIEIDNNQNHLAAGMTSKARIPLTKVPAITLSPAYLGLDENGILGIKVVNNDQNNTNNNASKNQKLVQFVNVEIISQNQDGITVHNPNWQNGEMINVITDGSGFVSGGSFVNIASSPSKTQDN